MVPSKEPDVANVIPLATRSTVKHPLAPANLWAPQIPSSGEVGGRAQAAGYIFVGHIRTPIPSGCTPTENTPITEFVPTSITVTRPACVFEATYTCPLWPSFMSIVAPTAHVPDAMFAIVSTTVRL